LAGFEEAAVDNARAGACKMGFLKNIDEDAEIPGDEQDLEIKAEPATFPILPAGYEIQEYNPQYPNAEFDPFSKAVLRGIASGIGASYNTLANDLTAVNFSSLRSGLLDERDGWMCIQGWLISTLMRPVYLEWLKYSLLAGKITMPNGKSLPPEKYDKFKNVTWQARRWQWVDPAKDVAANIDSINNNLKSRSQVIREQGVDPEDVFSEIDKENQMLASLNVNKADIKNIKNDNTGENNNAEE